MLCDLFMFVSYEYTSYSKGFCLFMTGSLFVPFLASKLLDEQIKKWDIIGILLGFVGMVLLVRPWESKEGDLLV